MEMKLLRKGAEAELYLSEFEGRPALLKKRVEKGYRNRALDSAIRDKRTSLEANLLRRAATLGINTPHVLEVKKEGSEIWMEFIDGSRVKDILNKGNLKKICTGIGIAIGKMHAADLIHGDLTTSNILLKDGKLFFIDFGLGFQSRKAEDKAVDLLVFRKTFEATHCSLMKGWDYIQEGYLKEFPKGKEVVERIPAIEGRARYH